MVPYKENVCPVFLGSTNKIMCAKSCNPRLKLSLFYHLLLCVMDLRLTALTWKVADMFEQGVDSKCSIEDFANIEEFSYHFEAINVR
ncbi:hypothetical protein KY290_033879 [Solanum tuberosum]|uniref:Uncharacterized protein n=1 Tax=Solanum tuberosum TaxID=4113 RepID=A0ABQ7U3C0_SOLTU|nr:hypothetical protein KY289_033253 [Solanum tuberosum]KAH0647898.1 hypothetical protein KY285_033146 [Solanum tuberosum]KAH0740836.1 hypothetical protein KY290_033879 [Solanum tuberosum]